MRDPRARARAHHGLERGDEAARRALDARCRRPSVRTWMYGSRLDTTITSLPCSSLRSVARSACWSQMRWLPSSGRYCRSRSRIRSRRSRAIGRSSGAVADDAGRRMPSPRSSARSPLHPAAPRELRDDHGDERDARAERDEEIEEVAARLLAAALDEAHVVDQREPARSGTPSASILLHGDVQRAACPRACSACGWPSRASSVGAVERLREVERSRSDDPLAGDAEADRVQPLVAEHPAEELLDARRRALSDRGSRAAPATVDAMRLERASRSRTNQRSMSESASGTAT